METQEPIIEDPIVIVGHNRTGTSLIGHLLSELGVWHGAHIAGHASNPKGFYENLCIRQEIINKILDYIGCDKNLYDHWPQKNQYNVPAIDMALCDALAREGYRGGIWFYKDCRLSVFWPLWLTAFPNAKWIIANRPREDVVNSCVKAQTMQKGRTAEFWGRRVDFFEKHLNALRHSGLWTYDIRPMKILEGDWSEFNELVDKLGIPKKNIEHALIQKPDLTKSKLTI